MSESCEEKGRFDPNTGPVWAFRKNITRYNFASMYVKDKVVFDVACGTGYGSYLLSKVRKAAMVVGLNVSQEAIQKAQHCYKSDALFVVGNVTELPFDNNCFDVVISYETIEHLENPSEYLSEIKRVLKPKGYFLLSTPNKNVTSPFFRPLNTFHKKEYKLRTLKNLLQNYFGEIEAYGQQFLDRKSYISIVAKMTFLFFKRKIESILESFPCIKKLAKLMRAASLNPLKMVKGCESETRDRFFEIKFLKNGGLVPMTLILVCRK